MSRTYVVFLLDRTGSMGRTKPATIEGFNTYLAALKDQPGSDQIIFTLIQFYGRGVDTIYQRVPLQDVQPLRAYSFQPQGRTPLVDAACKTIKAVERTVAEMGPPPQSQSEPTATNGPNVVLCIQSDGDDNASVEYDWDALRQLVAEKAAQRWQLFFMGAGINPKTQAQWMGLSPDNTLSYSMDLKATREVFAFAAEQTASLISRAGAGNVSETSHPPSAESGSAIHHPAATTKQKIPDDIAV